MKILVIDDEDDIRRIARLSLGKVGRMEVVDAASGADGVRRAEEEHPDAILLDVMLLLACYAVNRRAPVAQLDRASASGAEGCRFEPYRAYQSNQ